MLIEEPLTGENVARSVRENAFQDILAELQRALEIMSANDADTAFEETARGSSCFSCQRSDIEKGLLMVLDLAKVLTAPQPSARCPRHGSLPPSGPGRRLGHRPTGLLDRSVAGRLTSASEACRGVLGSGETLGLLPSGASGAVLVPADASTPYKDLYIALLRGSSLPDSLVTVRARICSPSEGSKAFRLATRRTEGLAASTLLRPLSIGRVDGLPATLVLLRPKHRAPPVPQQLQLHCVAAGCPVLGDRLHDADRRLDFRFEAPDPSPRLMLHCLRVQVEGQEIRAPEDLRANLEIERELVDLEEAETELMLAEDGPELPDTWDTFAGGLPSQILDDTSWDRLRLPRASPQPEFELSCDCGFAFGDEESWMIWGHSSWWQKRQSVVICDTGRCTCQMLWLVLAYLWGLACLIGTIGWKNLFLVPFAFGPFLCVAARHVCSAAGCCGKRWHREAELFVRETTIMFEGKVIEEPGTACAENRVRDRTIMFEGKISEEPGTACIASWPGLYATAWHYLARQARATHFAQDLRSEHTRLQGRGPASRSTQDIPCRSSKPRRSTLRRRKVFGGLRLEEANFAVLRMETISERGGYAGRRGRRFTADVSKETPRGKEPKALCAHRSGGWK
eukprot:g26759.t1